MEVIQKRGGFSFNHLTHPVIRNKPSFNAELYRAVIRSHDLLVNACVFYS